MTRRSTIAASMSSSSACGESSRRMLAAKLIRTERGVGYLLDADVEVSR